MAPRTHHFKGKVRRAASEDTEALLARQAIIKNREKHIRGMQQARAAETLKVARQKAMRQSNLAASPLQKKTTKSTRGNVMTALAANSPKVLKKMIWASWEVFVILAKEEKDLKYREQRWRMSCAHHQESETEGHHPGSACGANWRIQDSKFEL